MGPELPPEDAEALPPALRTARALSLVHRLLAGSGRASLLAYRSEPQLSLDSLVHGLTASGQLLVGGHLGEQSELLAEHSIEIRMDIEKQAPVWEVRITAATIHLLGQLRWLSPQEADDYLFEGMLPEQLASIATEATGRLGIISTDRVLLHDSCGVSPVDFGVVAERHIEYIAGRLELAPFPCPAQEVDAQFVLSSHQPDQLLPLFEAVAQSRLPGAVWSRPAAAEACPHVAERVFCADVDSTGVTLMHLSATGTRTVVACFDHAATTLGEFTDSVQAMFPSDQVQRSW